MVRESTASRFCKLQKLVPEGYTLTESGAPRGERRYFHLEKPPHYALTTQHLNRIEAAITKLRSPPTASEGAKS